MRVLRTTGVRTEANLPFAGLHQLLRPILAGIDALPKPQYAALGVAFGLVEGAADDPFLIALATLTLLADAAAHTPILVVADDVQWLDRPSADALAFVARRLGSDPLVMVVELRDGEASPFDAAGIDELALHAAERSRRPGHGVGPRARSRPFGSRPDRPGGGRKSARARRALGDDSRQHVRARAPGPPAAQRAARACVRGTCG